jgi:hypothetical protein
MVGSLPAFAGEPSQPPSALQPPAIAPGTGLRARELHRPPALVGSGDLARRNTRAFIDWASLSTMDEREDARREIAAAAGNPDIVRAVIDEVRAARQTDHSRALISLAILGEMRSAEGEKFLRDFINQPLPRHGTLVEGDLIEATALAQLQAKAVDGLAWRRTRAADAEVMRLAGQHESKIVRAEAISAYLWNHGDTDEARRALAPHVRKDELILLDRVRRVSGESAESFNRKLEAFLRAHPEVVPPAPQLKSTPARPAEQNPRRFDEPPPAQR